MVDGGQRVEDRPFERGRSTATTARRLFADLVAEDARLRCSSSARGAEVEDQGRCADDRRDREHHRP